MLKETKPLITAYINNNQDSCAPINIKHSNGVIDVIKKTE